MSEPKLHWQRRKTVITSAVGDPIVYDLIHTRAEGRGSSREVEVGVVRQEAGQWRGEVVGEPPSRNGMLFAEAGQAKEAVRKRVIERLKGAR